MEKEIVTVESVWTPLKRISWSSILAGVLIAIIVQLLLSLLGVGIGMGSIDAMDEQNPAKGLGTGSLIWYAVTSLIALFAGGWIAGRLAQTPRKFDAFLHGILTWSVVTLISLYMLTTAVGNIIGGASKLVGQAIGAAGNVVGQTVQAAVPDEGVKGINLDNLKQEARQLLNQAGITNLQPGEIDQKMDSVGNKLQQAAKQFAANPQAGAASIDDIVDNLFKEGKATVSDIDRRSAVNTIVARTDKSEREAKQIVANWEKTYAQMQANVQQAKEEAEAKAREAADAAAEAISTGAFIAFISLLIGCVVAGFGAKAGNHSKLFA